MKCREKKSLKIHRIERVEFSLFDGFYSISCLKYAWNMHEVDSPRTSNVNWNAIFCVNLKRLKYGRMKFYFARKALKMRKWKLRLCHKHHLVMASSTEINKPTFLRYLRSLSLLAMTYIYNFIDKWLSCTTWWWTPEYKPRKRRMV